MKQFNPLLLPRFQSLDPKASEIRIRAMIDNHKRILTRLLSQQYFTWDNLMQPLEEIEDILSKAVSPVHHLYAVTQTEDWRKTYNRLLPHLTQYQTELAQNETLYQAILSLQESDDYKKYNDAQKKIIEHAIRDFKLAGVHLSENQKKHLQTLSKKLIKLGTTFSENVLDATQAFSLHLTKEEEIKGLPESALYLAIDAAKKKGLSGYLITLDFPSYSTAIKFLENRHLRETLYEAYVTRASDQGPCHGKWDNSDVMNEILTTEFEIAQCVGFKNYAEYSLKTKMAKTPDQVLGFLKELLVKSKPFAKKELEAIKQEAKQNGIQILKPWDVPYYSEKLQAKLFHFTQEDVRPYFPIDRVFQGLFSLVKELFSITLQEQNDIDTWHPDVRFFSILDQDQQLRGGLYIDLYARLQKKEGAWMDVCHARKRLSPDEVQHPVAYLTCNFMRPTQDKPALLTHDDILTLFHEFGHCLHHLLTMVDYPAVGGTAGVPWDAIEFPSQFMENFAWEKDCLMSMASHYQTGMTLPDDLYQNLIKSKYFQTGMQMLRQLEFALFDFKLHLSYHPTQKNQIQEVLDKVRKETALLPVPSYNRFQNTFSHVFAGGYAAGYYSYKWAEVLSADAYASFENKKKRSVIGKSFMKNILEIGGSKDPMDAFVAFKGKKPTVNALLKANGLTS